MCGPPMYTSLIGALPYPESTVTAPPNVVFHGLEGLTSGATTFNERTIFPTPPMSGPITNPLQCGQCEQVNDEFAPQEDTQIIEISGNSTPTEQYLQADALTQSLMRVARRLESISSVGSEFDFIADFESKYESTSGSNSRSRGNSRTSIPRYTSRCTSISEGKSRSRSRSRSRSARSGDTSIHVSRENSPTNSLTPRQYISRILHSRSKSQPPITAKYQKRKEAKPVAKKIT